jgi:hypothetical protein
MSVSIFPPPQPKQDQAQTPASREETFLTKLMNDYIDAQESLEQAQMEFEKTELSTGAALGGLLTGGLSLINHPRAQAGRGLKQARTEMGASLQALSSLGPSLMARQAATEKRDVQSHYASVLANNPQEFAYIMLSGNVPDSVEDRIALAQLMRTLRDANPGMPIEDAYQQANQVLLDTKTSGRAVTPGQRSRKEQEEEAKARGQARGKVDPIAVAGEGELSRAQSKGRVTGEIEAVTQLGLKAPERNGFQMLYGLAVNPPPIDPREVPEWRNKAFAARQEARDNALAYVDTRASQLTMDGQIDAERVDFGFASQYRNVGQLWTQALVNNELHQSLGITSQDHFAKFVARGIASDTDMTGMDLALMLQDLGYVPHADNQQEMGEELKGLFSTLNEWQTTAPTSQERMAVAMHGMNIINRLYNPAWEPELHLKIVDWIKEGKFSAGGNLRLDTVVAAE